MPVEIAEIKASQAAEQACVDLLQGLLKKAESGEIEGLVAVFSEPGMYTGHESAGLVGTAVLGEMDIAQNKLIEVVSEWGIDR